MSEELRSCLYCGSKDIDIDGNGQWHWVVCSDCSACGPADLGESGAIERWNTRPIEDELRKQLVGLTANSIYDRMYEAENQRDELQRKLDECELALDDMRLGRAIAEKKLAEYEGENKLWHSYWTVQAIVKERDELQRNLDIAVSAMKDIEFNTIGYGKDIVCAARAEIKRVSSGNLQKPPETANNAAPNLHYPLDGDPHVFQPFKPFPKTNWHVGVDWDVPVGTPVHACLNGMVYIMAQDSKVYGRFIGIQHDDGYCSWYAHLSKTMVKVGDFVEAGQIIGLTGGAVGSDGAGQTTGAHLHFEVRTPGNLDNNKKNVDPIEYIERYMGTK